MLIPTPCWETTAVNDSPFKNVEYAHTKKSLSLEHHVDYYLSSESLLFSTEREINIGPNLTAVFNIHERWQPWQTFSSLDWRCEILFLQSCLHCWLCFNSIGYLCPIEVMLSVSIMQLFTSVNVSAGFISCLHFVLLCYGQLCTNVKNTMQFPLW